MQPDVIVVGGGLMGCLSALRLAERGLSVTVLERSVPGAEASTAAAGILGPCVESHGNSVALRIGIASRERHAALADQLQAQVGTDVGFRRCGVLKIALDDGELARLRDDARALRGEGCRVEDLDAGGALELEPNCSQRVCGGLHLPEEGQVDPRALLLAVALAAERAGVRFMTGATVRALNVEASHVTGATVDDERIDAGNVVVAAGSWTTLVPGVGLGAEAIYPVRGQMVTTRTRPPLFERVVFSETGYIVTRPDGRVLCGSTEERVGFRRGVTLGGLRRVIDTAVEIAPSLEEATVDEHWSSFRPGTPDGLPLVGATDTDGLFIASGHFRNGILLGPITADWIADAVTGTALPQDAHALRPTRFATTTSG